MYIYKIREIRNSVLFFVRSNMAQKLVFLFSEHPSVDNSDIIMFVNFPQCVLFPRVLSILFRKIDIVPIAQKMLRKHIHFTNIKPRTRLVCVPRSVIEKQNILVGVRHYKILQGLSKIFEDTIAVDIYDIVIR